MRTFSAFLGPLTSFSPAAKVFFALCFFPPRAQHLARQPQQNETSVCESIYSDTRKFWLALLGPAQPCPMPGNVYYVWPGWVYISAYTLGDGGSTDWQFPQNLMEWGKKSPKENGSMPEIYYIVHFQCTFFSRATSFFAVLNSPKLLTSCLTEFEWGSWCIRKVMRVLEEGFSTSELLVCWAEYIFVVRGCPVHL